MTRAALACLVVVIVGCAGSEAIPAAPATTSASVAAPSSATSTAPASTAPASTAPATAVPDTTPPTTTPISAPPTSSATPASFETVDAGPYAVGVQTVTVVDTARDRPLTVDVWFPLDAGTTGAPHEYTLLPGVYYRSPAAISATADDIADDSPFPLVVYSHGSGGLRYLASYYTEAIASHGYVVVAPDHTGNTAIERLAGADAEFDVTALNRPNDVRALIDAFTAPDHPEAGAFAAAIDGERIAVTGHSFGGFTAMAMAAGYTNALGTFEADPRVDAIIPLAPATGDGDGRLLSDADLAAIAVPTLVIAGTADVTTRLDPNVTRIWDLATNARPLLRAELVAAQHQSFTDICDYQASVPTLVTVPPIVTDTIDTFAQEGCTPADMPIERAKQLTNTLAIRFLDAVFNDGPPLDPSTVALPDDLTLEIRT